jgi:ABC-2 type transport system ATP-binding protein
MPDFQSVLKISNAAKSYGRVTAYANVSLELAAGETMAIAGPNGGGKTTLLRTIAGLLAPAALESVQVLGGYPSRDLELRRQIGYVPDEDDLLDQLTGVEYVRFMAAAYRQSEMEVVTRAYEIAGRLNLSLKDMREKLIGGYSHGMRKKLQLLAVLAVRPKLLVVDEPTNGLDPTVVILLKQVLREQGETAVVLASHNLSFAQDVSKRVMLLRQYPLEAGETAAVLRQHGVARLEDVYERLVLQAA